MKKFILCSLVSLGVQHQVYAMEGNKKALDRIHYLQKKEELTKGIKDNTEEQIIFYQQLSTINEGLVEVQEKKIKKLEEKNKTLNDVILTMQALTRNTSEQTEKDLEGTKLDKEAREFVALHKKDQEEITLLRKQCGEYEGIIKKLMDGRLIVDDLIKQEYKNIAKDMRSVTFDDEDENPGS